MIKTILQRYYKIIAMKSRWMILTALMILVLEGPVAKIVGVNSIFDWILLNTLFFSIIPLIIIFLLKEKPRNLGLSLETWKTSLLYATILVFLATPFMIYGSRLPQFTAYYPLWGPARSSIQNLVLLEIGMLILMFNTEFFFRGFLLFSLRDYFKSINIKKAEWTAIIIHAIPYAVVHIGKPGLEVPYSFFVGIVFGYIALKTRSILTPLAAHWSSSVIFDLMVLWI